MINGAIAEGASSRQPGRSVDLQLVRGASLALDAVLTQLPAKLVGVAGARYPLLEAVQQSSPSNARVLMLVGAVTHRHADERRTAEYLLRHRDRLVTRGAHRLMASARYAVEMDLRHSEFRELPVEPAALARRQRESAAPRRDDCSPGEAALSFVTRLVGDVPPAVENALLDAIVVFLGLARRNSRRSAVPSLIAMRPSARPEARLVTHLRRDGLSRVWSRRIARLLIGPDGSPLETALLWWVARGASPEDVPVGIRTPWLRDLNGLIGTSLTLHTANH